MLAPDVAAGSLVMLDFQVPAMKTMYGIITLAERSLAPATVAFLDLLRSVESEIFARATTSCAGQRPTPKHPTRRAARTSA